VFDHLIWWQVLALLAPVVTLTYYIRYREQMRLITPYSSLSAPQKTWILLSVLPPGVDAKVQLLMDPQERAIYMQSGQSLMGAGHRLYEPVVKEFLSFYPRKEVPATEGHAVDRLRQLVSQVPPIETLQVIRRYWPTGLASTSTATVAPTATSAAELPV
jgi:hypothetical protein